MTRNLAILLSVSLLGPLLPAQAPPGPAPQLGKLDRLVGSWTGKGTVTMAPDAAAMSWTATSSYRKVLGGHFIREDTIIDLGPGGPGSLRFISFLGWDRENERYLGLSVNNLGQAEVAETHWADSDTMVTVQTAIEEGQVAVDRWTTKLGKDTFSIRDLRAVGAGDFFTHIEGTFARAVENMELTAAKGVAEAAFQPPAAEAEQLHKMAGTYRMKGWFVMAPGQPKTDFAATEVVRPIFGGTILELSVKADPIEGWPDYEGWAALAWDSRTRRYKQIYVNNIGQIGTMNGWWAGKDRMIFIRSGLQQGTPGVGRMTLTFGPDGAVKSASAHGIMGTGEPLHSYDGTYTRKN